MRAPRQVFEMLNALRANTNAYVRVWSSGSAFTVEGRDLPNAPPSLSMILSRAQDAATIPVNLRGSKLAEIVVPIGQHGCYGIENDSGRGERVKGSGARGQGPARDRVHRAVRVDRIRGHDNHVGDDRLSGLPARAHERLVADARWTAGAGAEDSRRCSLRISRRFGASRRRRMDRFIWARATAGDCIGWMARARHRWCGRRISRKFSRSTVDAKGVVYAGTSPDGKIYRIENGKATEYFDPHARYIWALKFGRDGSLFAATGDQGKIFRVTSCRAGKRLLRNRPGARDVSGDRSRRTIAGGLGAERDSLSHHRERTRRSCCTMRIFRRFARLFRRRMGRFMWLRSAAASRGEPNCDQRPAAPRKR